MGGNTLKESCDLVRFFCRLWQILQILNERGLVEFCADPFKVS